MQLDIDLVKQKTRELTEGYKCLSKEYKNAHAKLEFQCSKKHIFKMEWSNFQQGKRCPICSGNKKKTIEEVKKFAKSIGYGCLSNKYINARNKLEFVCNKNHRFKMDFWHLKRGQRCPICKGENSRGESHPNWKNYSKEELQQLEEYRANIRQITNQNFREHYYIINPFKLPRNKNNVSPEVIASPVNLQMLTAKDNRRKNNRSDMTKEMLYDLYYQFKKEMNK